MTENVKACNSYAASDLNFDLPKVTKEGYAPKLDKRVCAHLKATNDL